MATATVLYKSEQIRKKITELFANPDPNDRRIAMVAYVGADAEAYLPSPKGLTLVCNPTPGGTHPRGIERLRKRGAQIWFCNKLHMKVYWSKKRGCVITSANASTNALGAVNLKEAGVALPPGQVDIDQLWHTAKPRKANKTAIGKLIRATRILGSRWHKWTGEADATQRSFMDWYRSPYRNQNPWKLDWWNGEADVPKEAIEETRARYGRRDPDEFIECDKNQYEEGDWSLQYLITKTGKVTKVQWMFVDFIVPVNPKEHDVYHAAAVQAFPLAKCPAPPFKCNTTFKEALRKALEEYGLKRLRNSVTPPRPLIDAIAKVLQKGKAS